jgi:hypothetical protein
MRAVVLMIGIGLWATGAAAQDAEAPALDKCAQSEVWFNVAVDSRLLGDNKRQVRRKLSPDMGRDAADQLADFVFDLPVELLTPEVGKAARAQCEAL